MDIQEGRLRIVTGLFSYDDAVLATNETGIVLGIDRKYGVKSLAELSKVVFG